MEHIERLGRVCGVGRDGEELLRERRVVLLLHHGAVRLRLLLLRRGVVRLLLRRMLLEGRRRRQLLLVLLMLIVEMLGVIVLRMRVRLLLLVMTSRMLLLLLLRGVMLMRMVGRSLVLLLVVLLLLELLLLLLLLLMLLLLLLALLLLLLRLLRLQLRLLFEGGTSKNLLLIPLENFETFFVLFLSQMQMTTELGEQGGNALLAGDERVAQSEGAIRESFVHEQRHLILREPSDRREQVVPEGGERLVGAAVRRMRRETRNWVELLLRRRERRVESSHG